MANLFFTGFENVSALSQIPEFIGGSTAISTTTRYGSGRSLRHNEGGFSRVSYIDINNASDTVYFGGAFYFDSWAVTSGWERHLLVFASTGSSNWGTVHASLRIDAASNTGDAPIKVYGPSGTLLGTSSTNLSINTWYYIEMKLKVHDTLGEIEVKVDNSSVINVSGVDTRNNSLSSTVSRIWAVGEAGSKYIDDLYINNAEGDAPHNTFYGEIRVDAVVPSSDSSVQFTRSAGATNVSNIDDGVSPDGDSTYNSSSTIGHKDLFGLSGYTAPNGGTILGVGVSVSSKRQDAGSRQFRSVVKSNTTEVVGATSTLTSAYVFRRQNVYTDPATSSAFADATAINNLKVGYEIVT